MKRVAFTTLGCKVNQYDTDVMKAVFKKRGYLCVKFSDTADIYIINTCTVTGMAAKKSRQMVNRARKTSRNALVVVTGCLGQLEGDEVLKLTQADIVTGNAEKSRMADIVEAYENEKMAQVFDISREEYYIQKNNSVQEIRTRIFIKVQDGCNNYCSYCIIPYVRGKSRSRAIDDVIAEIKEYADKGVREVVLTGIHLDSYGKDLDDASLIDLLEKADKIYGISRIRLSSLDPLIITDEFAERAANLIKLCPHFHLSLQSGCNETLKRMNRRYTSEQYSEAVKILRKHIGDIAVTTDIIVGFPGETDDEFKKTLKFVGQTGFLKVHTFKFSPRKGTKAYAMDNQVSESVKKKRSEVLSTEAIKSGKKYMERFMGETVDVLTEQQSEENPEYWEGYTKEYMKILFKWENGRSNVILPVKIFKINSKFALGRLQDDL